MGQFSEFFKYDLSRVMRPLAFHGADKSGPFFEGWYYKFVSENGDKRISVIPGVYIGKEANDSHAFIQFTDGDVGGTSYFKFPFEDFRFLQGEMDLWIGENHFSNKKLFLNINKKDIKIKGELTFKNLKPWPIRVISPGVMGPFAWVPGMECYHGIVSMDHLLSGSLLINGNYSNFSGGRGYMEKDWGRAMPDAWIWVQCNHFETQGTSLSVSIATIPWIGFKFNGFLAGFLHDGNLHRFATYTGAKIHDQLVTKDKVHFSIIDKKRKLFITAHRFIGNELMAPTTMQMNRRITETLSAKIDVELRIKHGDKWTTDFAGTGEFAGLEVVGDLNS